MAIKRRFIRIEEIEQKTPLTKGDVLELVENGDLSFCAYVSLKKLGARYPTGRTPVCAVFDYEGIVGLHGKESKQFALKKTVHSVSDVIIKQPEKVKRWGSIEHYFGEIKSHIIEYHSNFHAQPKSEFFAFAQVAYELRPKQQFQNFVYEMNELLKKKTDNEVDKQIEKETIPCLYSKTVTISPSDLRLDLEEIEALGINEPQELIVEPSQIKTISSPSVETHPIKRIIERLVEQYPNQTSRKYWNLLDEEVDKDTRQFDKDSIIFDMNSDELHYFGLEDNTQKLSYRRFQNLLSDIRKKVHG